MKTTIMTEDEKRLVEQHLHLVNKIVNAVTRSYKNLLPEDFEDLIQNGYLALCRAAMNYDGKRDFEPFANTCIRNSIREYWRQHGIPSDICISLESSFEQDSNQIYDSAILHSNHLDNILEQSVIRKETASLLHELGKNSSNTVRKGIFSLLLQQNGYSSTELANYFGASPNVVRAWQSKAKKALKNCTNLYSLLAS